ncbi:MAG: transcriptional regulator [Dictyoglomaceae bacterium]
MQLNFNPLSKEEIHKLETSLLIATLFREEVIKEIRDSTERLTWVDSLAVAAGALARSKAGMSVSEIAEELGRTEATIREHIKGSSKAGKLVNETFEMLKSGEINPDTLLSGISKIESLKKILLEIKEKLEEVIKEL